MFDFSAEDDLEFNAINEDDADDEETLEEQESKEKDKVDHKEEIENLEKEGIIDVCYQQVSGETKTRRLN